MIATVMILAELPILVMSDTGASLTDSKVPDNEMITGQTKATNS